MSRKKEKAKIGRPVELQDLQDLPRRHLRMRQFLENYWGRIGLRLQGVRTQEDVREILLLVPHVEQMPPFNERAICLIREQAVQASETEIRGNRDKYKRIVDEEDQLWRRFHVISQDAQRLATAFKSELSHFGSDALRWPFFAVLCLLAKELRVCDLNQQSQSILKDVQQVQRDKDLLRDKLNAQEAWFARDQVVRFAKNARFSKTLDNFTGAMAGLPEWGWFHSRRTCEGLNNDTPRLTPYMLFLLIEEVTKDMRPLRLAKIENALKNRLFQAKTDQFLRSYASSHWYYLQDAVRSCEGVRKGELPFKIMDKFLFHLERPKSLLDLELARQNQLI